MRAPLLFKSDLASKNSFNSKNFEYQDEVMPLSKMVKQAFAVQQEENKNQLEESSVSNDSILKENESLSVISKNGYIFYDQACMRVDQNN